MSERTKRKYRETMTKTQKGLPRHSPLDAHSQAKDPSLFLYQYSAKMIKWSINTTVISIRSQGMYLRREHLSIDVVGGGRGWDVMRVRGWGRRPRKRQGEPEVRLTDVMTITSVNGTMNSGLKISLPYALATETGRTSMVQNSRRDSTGGGRARHWCEVQGVHNFYVMTRYLV